MQTTNDGSKKQLGALSKKERRVREEAEVERQSAEAAQQKARRVEKAERALDEVRHTAAEACLATETACEQRISELLEKLATLRVSMEAETTRADAAEGQLALAAQKRAAAWDELMASLE